MPLYEFECDCGERAEILLPIKDYDQPQICTKCEKVMLRKMSASSSVRKQSNNEMVLDSLNSQGSVGPDANNYKPWIQEKVFAGLKEPPKTIR